ncbi:hypothetical protein [Shewanella sp. TB7-MNA-CIBAN-0143]|jgi:hypothetical protein|uniref:DUF6896 domain-containing protein n=1 Tax=unclassified Shewanella TaxID=196818 RepID=UPI003323ED3B
MNPDLLKLVSLFLSKVHKAEEIMKEHFKIEEPMYFRQSGIERSGKFYSYSYAFHGIGCRFKFESFTVDFDYAENGRIDGFDLWRLSRFGEQFDEFRVYIESGQIDLDFKTAEESGEIIKFSQGSLYYAENT